LTGDILGWHWEAVTTKMMSRTFGSLIDADLVIKQLRSAVAILKVPKMADLCPKDDKRESATASHIAKWCHLLEKMASKNV
jgi:hypothetical protein